MGWCDSEHVSDDLMTDWYMYLSRFYSLQNSTRPWVRRLAEETFYAGGVFPWDRHGCQWFGSSEGTREKAHSDCSSTHKMSQRYLAMLSLKRNILTYSDCTRFKFQQLSEWVRDIIIVWRFKLNKFNIHVGRCTIKLFPYH